MKLEINYREKNGKKYKHMQTKQHATKKPQLIRKLTKEEIRKYLENNKNKNTSSQNSWDRANTCNKDIHSNTGISQETRKLSNNLTLHLNELEKVRTKPKVSRRKDKNQSRNK